MKIFLIRHAESESNVGSKTSDPSIISITEKGRAQSFELANKITDAPDLIIVTSYVRTAQTALPLIKKFLGVKVETWPLHEFTFLSPSLCRNTNSKERLPMVNEYWEKCDPDFIHGIGAESFNQFIERVQGCIQRFNSMNHKFVTIFAHGHVIRAIRLFMDSNQTTPEILMRLYRDNIPMIPVYNSEIFEVTLSRK
jgi:broad specificity phosphatase PhoE